MRNRILGFTIAAVAALAAGAAAAQASELPVIYNGTLGYAHISSTASPPGSNNWSCKPTAAHPPPVVLVHGTFADMATAGRRSRPCSYNHGYCVFALNYGSYAGAGSLGIYATGDIAESAEATVDASSTGCSPPRVPARSTSSVTRQGGMMPRYYLKYLGGAAKVHTLVGSRALATTAPPCSASQRSPATSPAPEPSWGFSARPAHQQIAGSSFLTSLNSGGDTVAGCRTTPLSSPLRRGRHPLHLSLVPRAPK